MLQCTRKIEFDYGHKVLGHGGKCKHLHGHRGVLELTVEMPQLNDLDMVIDFADIKKVAQDWVDTFWDHNLLLNDRDPLIGQIDKIHNHCDDSGDWEPYNAMLDDLFGGREPFRFYGQNPTAEVMAEVFAATMQEELSQRISPHLKVVKVRFYETPNCWAEWTQEVKTAPPKKHRTMYGD